MTPSASPGDLRDRIQGTVAIPVELAETMRKTSGTLSVRFVEDEWEVRYEAGTVTYLDGHRYLMTALTRLDKSLQDKEIDDE